MKSKIKENVQGTNNDGKETGTQSEIWGRRKKETLNQNRMKKQEFKKMRRLRNLWDNFKFSNIQIIGVPEGDEKEQDIENLCENIMRRES